MRSVVACRLVNVHSSQDLILAFLYRTSAIQLGVADIDPKCLGIEVQHFFLVFFSVLHSGLWSALSYSEYSTPYASPLALHRPRGRHPVDYQGMSRILCYGGLERPQ